MASIDSLRNLGPASVEQFAQAGITTAEEIIEMGADAAYERLLRAGTRPHFISYYVLHMAVQGRPWNDCKGPEKDALRAAFDAMKALVKPTDDSAVEKILNEIGTGTRRA
ncbi:MAG: TfoX/Sxy family protein [Pseudomonadota bacterium]